MGNPIPRPPGSKPSGGADHMRIMAGLLGPIRRR